MNRRVLEACFNFTAVAILVLTGLAKTWSAFGHTKALALPDPITGLAFRHLLLLVGLLELGIAAVCLFGKTQKWSLALIAWLATTFVVYRLGLWWIGWHQPCGCLGNLTDALRISPTTADQIMKGILAYLLIGSYWLLWRQWRCSSRASSGATSPEGLTA